MLDRVVATPVWARTLVWLLTPVAGAAALYGLLHLIPVLLAVSWLPLPGWVEKITEIPEPWAFWVALGVGAIGGLVLASLIDAESMTVRLAGAEVVLTRPAHEVTVPRADVAVAFHEKSHLVLLGRTGRELAREPTNLLPRTLETAFTSNGIAWSAADPYDQAYQRWIPQSPDLPAAAHAVFTARQKALKGGDSDDAAELRTELSRLGYVVRDRDKKQYWRQVSIR